MFVVVGSALDCTGSRSTITFALRGLLLFFSSSRLQDFPPASSIANYSKPVSRSARSGFSLGLEGRRPDQISGCFSGEKALSPWSTKSQSGTGQRQSKKPAGRNTNLCNCVRTQAIQAGRYCRPVPRENSWLPSASVSGAVCFPGAVCFSRDC